MLNLFLVLLNLQKYECINVTVMCKGVKLVSKEIQELSIEFYTEVNL